MEWNPGELAGRPKPTTTQTGHDDDDDADDDCDDDDASAGGSQVNLLAGRYGASPHRPNRS